MKSALNDEAHKKNDHQFALRLKDWSPSRFEAISDTQLSEQVGYARRIAASFGVQAPLMRARWVMIHTCLAPDFWRNEAVY